MIRWILGIALLLASDSELAAQGKGIRFWNLTTATISGFQLSPAGKEGTRKSIMTSGCALPASSRVATTPRSAIATSGNAWCGTSRSSQIRCSRSWTRI